MWIRTQVENWLFCDTSCKMIDVFNRVQPVTRPCSLYATRAHVGSQPACAAWWSYTTLREICITDRRWSPLPFSPRCSVPARADGTTVTAYREGANDGRLELPVTRKHSARPSVSSRVASIRSQTNGHMPTSCKPGPTLRKQRVILGPEPTHPVRHLGSALEGSLQVPGRIPQRSQTRMVLNHGSLPGAFNTHFKRFERAAARAGVNPATPTPRRTQRLSSSSRPECHPRRLLTVSSWWMLREIEACFALVCILLRCRGTRGAAHRQK